MQRLRVVLLVVFFLSLSGCASTHEVTVAIHEALFKEFGSDTIVIRERIAAVPDEISAQEDRDFYSSYEFEPQGANHKASDFGTLSVHLIPKSEHEALFKDGCEVGWKRFHSKYPNARRLFELSVVGFRERHSEALVYISGGYGCLAARGDIVLLEKRDGKWKIVREWNLWIS